MNPLNWVTSVWLQKIIFSTYKYKLRYAKKKVYCAKYTLLLISTYFCLQLFRDILVPCKPKSEITNCKYEVIHKNYVGRFLYSLPIWRLIWVFGHPCPAHVQIIFKIFWFWLKIVCPVGLTNPWGFLQFKDPWISRIT